MNTKNFKRTKLACYTAYFTMSSVFSLPPLLFAALQDIYSISYTLLGTLVLTNFCTQLTVDLIFTVFSFEQALIKRANTHRFKIIFFISRYRWLNFSAKLMIFSNFAD